MKQCVAAWEASITLPPIGGFFALVSVFISPCPSFRFRSYPEARRDRAFFLSAQLSVSYTITNDHWYYVIQDKFTDHLILPTYFLVLRLALMSPLKKEALARLSSLLTGLVCCYGYEKRPLHQTFHTARKLRYRTHFQNATWVASFSTSFPRTS